MSAANTSLSDAPAAAETDARPYDNDPDVAPILAALKNYQKPILVTGKAGTGKSTLVKYIRDCGDFPNAVVLAPTGVAAINISGQTVHSFFRLPPRIFTPETLEGQRKNRLWAKVDLIIVDEISMVRSDVVDGMDYILRKARKNQEPFGGAKMLFVGDFHQLPPVIPQHEKEMMTRMGYVSGYAYASKVFERVQPEKFELRTVHRQSDPKFLSILSDLRSHHDPSNAIRALNAMCYGPHRDGAVPMMLTGTNRTAARYNAEGLTEIDAKVHTFKARSEGTFNLKNDSLPASEIIDLKVGARVMTLMNDVQKRWVNGSLGTVTDISDESISVRFDHSRDVGEVKIASWENIRYEWDEKLEHPIAAVIGTYAQIPVSLAWAVTIHKSQGLTLEDVRVDLEQGAFAPGQTYVALSRARSLAGLSLATKIQRADIIVDRQHDKYLEFEGDGPFEAAPETDSGTYVPETYGLIPIYTVEKFAPNVQSGFRTDFQRTIEIFYVDNKGNTSLRKVTAQFIIQSSTSHLKYLVGYCELARGRRSFRFDRIQRVFDEAALDYISDGIEDFLLGLKAD